MNAVFFKSSGRLASELFVWFCLILFPLLVMGTDATYTSPASVGNPPPNVDATNFYNAGTWNISTYPSRYETKNTLNYTNKGSMTGSIGWEFDFGSGSSGRTWSANFLNDNGATITANDVRIGTPLAQGELLTQESYLWVSATNIVNKGLMNAGAGGEIILAGSSINLSHSAGLQITPIAGGGGLNNFPSNSVFVPDTSIYDEYWDATNGDPNFIVGGSPWFPPTLGQFFDDHANFPCGVVGTVTIGPLTPDVVDSVSNPLGPYTLTLTNADMTTTSFTVYSNLYNQGVFVYTGPNNISGQIRFLPTFNPTNGFDIVAIQLGSVSTNVVTHQAEINAFYLVDSFAATTNHGLSRDFVINPGAACFGTPTFRPAGYVVSRTVPTEFLQGGPGLGVPHPTFFYDPLSFTNLIVVGGSYATYSCLIDNVAAQSPPGGSITNLPGRVHIYADNLNLNQAHVRAEAQIVVQTTNLITSANAIMDCQNLSFNLSSTNGQLNITNLVPSGVSRFHGINNMVTAVWSNYIVTKYPNFVVSNSMVIGESDITNVTFVHLSFTAMDASGIETIAPVTNQDLVLHSTNMVVSDSVLVSQSFLLDGLSATLLGNVTFIDAMQNWTYANAPKLRYFTNYGTLTIPNSAHFGDDGPIHYLAFVNNGSITAGGQTINSSNLVINSGGVNVCNSGGFVGIADSVQLTGAMIQSKQSDIQFFANSVQLNGLSTLDAAGALDLTVTNTLADPGIGSGNTINCQNGFNLFLKPAKGDLLGTAINSYAPLNAEVDHVWAGVDHLATAAGYVNNVAIGSLALIPQGAQESLYQPLFAFFGTTGNNGLYVRNLDLSQLANYYGEIAIDPSITIYYETVSLNPSVDTGSQTPEEFLNGMQFLDANGNPGGYMRSVSGGPLPPPQVNYGKMTGSYNAANGNFQLTVSSSAGPTNFVIQASADLKNWAPIYTNDGPFGFYTDPNAGSYSHRFYRTVPGQ